jgi:hypothetical protein
MLQSEGFPKRQCVNTDHEADSYGVSGPFWYASGATVQILLFATLAIE